MKKSLFGLSLSATLLLANNFYLSKNPIDINSRSSDFGGGKPIKETYQDGVGVFVVNGVNSEPVNNSGLNKLVFKYGEEALQLNQSLYDFVMYSNQASDKEKKLLETSYMQLNVTPIVDNRTCKTILDTGGSNGNGIYTLASGIKVYCNMSFDGGGWTLIVAQNENYPVNNWNLGIQADYDPTLSNGKSFVLNTTEIPEHTQTAFAKNLMEVVVASFNFNYSTGDIGAQDLADINTGTVYQIYRNKNMFFDYHDPEQLLRTTPSYWFDTLSIDRKGVAGGFDWGFSPNGLYPEYKGYSLLGNKSLSVEPNDYWTVFVR